MVKVTFSVDQHTVDQLKTTAERLGKPQSLVVREAIAEYAARAGRLTEAERRRMLRILDEVIDARATRPQADAMREIRAVRRARKTGGRRHLVE